MSKKKIIIAISAGVVLVVAITLALVVFILSAVGKQQKIDYYEMGEDTVPSIKLVVGEKNLKGVSSSVNNGITTKEYQYQSETALADVEQYQEYLREQEGYRVVKLEGQGDVLTYGKQSVDEGKIILIDIESTPFGYTIKIIKGEGEIDLYN